MNPNSNGQARISHDDSHDLRDALAVAKGWLEVLFTKWTQLNDHERFECVAGALLGAHQIGYLLDLMDGNEVSATDSPEAKMAEAFWKLAESSEFQAL